VTNGMPDPARRTIATAVRRILCIALASDDPEAIKAAAILSERALSTCEQEYAEESSAEETVSTEAKKDLLM
jgi:hypothetical protein